MPQLSLSNDVAEPAAPAPADAAARQVLREVIWMRAVAIAGLALAIVVLRYFLVDTPFLDRTGAVVLLLLVLDLATALRLRLAAPVGSIELPGQLTLDVAALTSFFYFAGGATNPFVDLFLLPVALAAARLSSGRLLFVALLTLGCYLLLSALHVPLPPAKPEVTGFHCFGAWVKYALCAGAVAFLIFNLASRLRDRERRLEQARQRSRTEDVLVRAGSLAAGAAHELRAPLCTMAVLVNELMQRQQDAASTGKSLRLLSRQIEQCRRILSELVPTGQAVEGARASPADRFIHDVAKRWRVLRPNARLELRCSGVSAPPELSAPVLPGLDHAVLSLLNNAADASPESVEMECEWTSRELSVRVLDRGPGIDPQLAARLGEPFITTKHGSGTGIGLALAKSTIERAGGRLQLAARAGGGTAASLWIPLAHPALAAQPAPAMSYRVRYLGASARSA